MTFISSSCAKPLLAKRHVKSTSTASTARRKPRYFEGGEALRNVTFPGSKSFAQVRAIAKKNFAQREIFAHGWGWSGGEMERWKERRRADGHSPLHRSRRRHTRRWHRLASAPHAQTLRCLAISSASSPKVLSSPNWT